MKRWGLVSKWHQASGKWWSLDSPGANPALTASPNTWAGSGLLALCTDAACTEPQADRKVQVCFKDSGWYVYLWLTHADVWQKTTKLCKAIILQLKKKMGAGWPRAPREDHTPCCCYYADTHPGRVCGPQPAACCALQRTAFPQQTGSFTAFGKEAASGWMSIWTALKTPGGTSLVVQWLRLCFLMQETHVRSLARQLSPHATRKTQAQSR